MSKAIFKCSICNCETESSQNLGGSVSIYKAKSKRELCHRKFHIAYVVARPFPRKSCYFDFLGTLLRLLIFSRKRVRTFRQNPIWLNQPIKKGSRQATFFDIPGRYVRKPLKKETKQRQAIETLCADMPVSKDHLLRRTTQR